MGKRTRHNRDLFTFVLDARKHTDVLKKCLPEDPEADELIDRLIVERVPVKPGDPIP